MDCALALWFAGGTAFQSELMTAKDSAQDELLQVSWACLHTQEGLLCARLSCMYSHCLDSGVVLSFGYRNAGTQFAFVGVPAIQAVMQRLEECGEQEQEAAGTAPQEQQEQQQEQQQVQMRPLVQML